MTTHHDALATADSIALDAPDRPDSMAPGTAPSAEPTPSTGDAELDAAVSQLTQAAAAQDSDAELEAGQIIHELLTSRLGDLRG